MVRKVFICLLACITLQSVGMQQQVESQEESESSESIVSNSASQAALAESQAQSASTTTTGPGESVGQTETANKMNANQSSQSVDLSVDSNSTSQDSAQQEEPVNQSTDSQQDAVQQTNSIDLDQTEDVQENVEQDEKDKVDEPSPKEDAEKKDSLHGDMAGQARPNLVPPDTAGCDRNSQPEPSTIIEQAAMESALLAQIDDLIADLDAKNREELESVETKLAQMHSAVRIDKSELANTIRKNMMRVTPEQKAKAAKILSEHETLRAARIKVLVAKKQFLGVKNQSVQEQQQPLPVQFKNTNDLQTVKIVEMPTDTALLEYGEQQCVNLEQILTHGSEILGQLEAAEKQKNDFDNSYFVGRWYQKWHGADPAAMQQRIDAIKSDLGAKFASKNQVEQRINATSTILQFSGDELVHNIHDISNEDLSELMNALDSVASDSSVRIAQPLRHQLALRKEIVVAERDRRGGFFSNCQPKSTVGVHDPAVEARQLQQDLAEVKTELAPAWLYSRLPWSCARDLKAQWPAYCKMFTKVQGLLNADERQRKAEIEGGGFAEADDFTCQHDCQLVYDEMLHNQLTCVKARSMLLELWNNKNWSDYKTQLEKLDSVFARCETALDARCSSFETQGHVEAKTVEEVASAEGMALHRKNIACRRTFDHFVKTCVKHLVFDKAFVAAGIFTDGVNRQGVIDVGGVKQFIADITTDKPDLTIAQIFREQHQKLEEQKQRDAANVAFLQEALRESSADTLQQQVVDLKKHAVENPASKNCRLLNFFADSAQQMVLIGQKKKAQGSSQRAKELFNSSSVVLQLGQALQKGGASIATGLVATMQPIIDQAAAAEGAKQELLLDTIKAGTLGIEVVQTLEAQGQAELAEFFKQLFNDRLEGLQELVDSYDGAPTPAASDERRLAELEQEIAELGELDTLQIMRGEVDCCQRIQGKVAADLAKVYLAFGKGFVKGGVSLLDPRTTIEGVVVLGNVSIFAVQQMDRLAAYQAAMHCGDYRRAEQFKAEFDTENARIAQQIKNGVDAFMQMSAEQRAEILGNLCSTIALAQPALAIQLHAVGKVLNVAGKGFKIARQGCNIARLGAMKKFNEVLNKLADNPGAIAAAADGVEVAVNVADDVKVADGLAAAGRVADDVAMLQEVEEIAGGAPKPWCKLGIDEIKKIGQQSLQDDIRAVQGSENDAWEFFKAQVKDFTETKPGVYVGNDNNGIIFVYRAVSKSGPPTIDVNGIKGLRKIKFINGVIQ